jgi:ferric-dicitrate binding protein FerR (iron transport regulator)
MNKRKARHLQPSDRLNEAIDWFVGNESASWMDHTSKQGWQDWYAYSQNKVAYAEVLRLRDQIAALPRPAPATRQALQQDLELSPHREANRPSRHCSVMSLCRRLRRRHSFLEAILGILLLSSALLAPVHYGSAEEINYARGSVRTQHQTLPPMARASTVGRLAPLIYRGCPLHKVIDGVQPYTQRPITIDSVAADLRYTGIIIQNGIDAWIRDLPLIYPDVDVIDCRLPQHHFTACMDPNRLIIRSRLSLHPESLQSAMR